MEFVVEEHEEFVAPPGYTTDETFAVAPEDVIDRPPDDTRLQRVP